MYLAMMSSAVWAARGMAQSASPTSFTRTLRMAFPWIESASLYCAQAESVSIGRRPRHAPCPPLHGSGLAVVAPCGDARHVDFQLERLIRTGVERRHRLRLGCQDAAFGVQKLEREGERRRRLGARVGEQSLQLRPLPVGRESRS